MRRRRRIVVVVVVVMMIWSRGMLMVMAMMILILMMVRRWPWWVVAVALQLEVERVLYSRWSEVLSQWMCTLLSSRLIETTRKLIDCLYTHHTIIITIIHPINLITSHHIISSYHISSQFIISYNHVSSHLILWYLIISYLITTYHLIIGKNQEEIVSWASKLIQDLRNENQRYFHNVVDNAMVAADWRQWMWYRLNEQLRISHEKMKNLSYNVQGNLGIVDRWCLLPNGVDRWCLSLNGAHIMRRLNSSLPMHACRLLGWWRQCAWYWEPHVGTSRFMRDLVAIWRVIC